MAPFRIVTLGDSIPWGQGLLESQKYDRMLADALAQAHSGGVTLERLAHSGAVIGAFGATGIQQAGEVPCSRLTILEQCDQFTNAPESVDLVLLNGGINDVGVATLLNPLALIPTLTSRITRACHDSMLLLLNRISSKFVKHSCRILVTGYYPITSSQSDPFGVMQLLKLYGIALPPFGDPGAEFLEPVIHRSHQFFAESTAALQRAIVDATDARITFVPSGFTDANAVYVPGTSLLWKLDLDEALSPEDPVADERHALCYLAHDGPHETFAREFCNRASAGHPNVAGALQFRDQLIAALGLAP
jgi:lysophospholipase L1-like esterase